MNATLTYDTGVGVTFSVTFDRWDSLQSERARWKWSIMTDVGLVIAHGDDLTTVVDTSLSSALGALLDFLAAAIESWDYEEREGRAGENGDLFPPAVRALNLSADDVYAWAFDLKGEDE